MMSDGNELAKKNAAELLSKGLCSSRHKTRVEEPCEKLRPSRTGHNVLFCFEADLGLAQPP